MVNGIRTSDPCGLNKGHGSKIKLHLRNFIKVHKQNIFVASRVHPKNNIWEQLVYTINFIVAEYNQTF